MGQKKQKGPASDEAMCLGLPVREERDDEARRLLDGIQSLVRRFAVAERADVNCCGLTVAQAATIEALAVVGPMRLGALGQRLGVQASTLTRNVDRLEKAGLVRREVDPEDARAARVALTAGGRKAARQVERQEEAFARTVLERIPAERRAHALGALQDLLVAVREATESCCPGAFDHLMTDFPGESCCGPAADSKC